MYREQFMQRRTNVPACFSLVIPCIFIRGSDASNKQCKRNVNLHFVARKFLALVLRFHEIIKANNAPKIVKAIRTFPKFYNQKSKCSSGQKQKLLVSYSTKQIKNILIAMFIGFMCANKSNYNFLQ
jgi:hypothetical protein